MTRTRWPVVLGMLLALAACTPAADFRATDISSVDWGADVVLQSHTGKRVSTADFRGKIVLLFFGYMHCADICPPTLMKLAALRKALESDAARVQVLFITVDPARDTAPKLATFLPAFDPSFIGLTGTTAEIAAVAHEYKVPYVPATAGSHHHLPHSGDVLVKDANGKMRLLFRQDTSVTDMAHDLRLLLQET